jgi:hypothetical protein
MTQDTIVTTAWWRKYTVGQWVYAAFALSISLALIWGLTVSRFVPTPLGDEVALAAAVAVAALAAWFGTTSYAFSKDNPNSKALLEKVPAFSSTPNRVFGLAGIALLFTFPAVETGFLEWWTWIFGAAGERTMTVDHFQTSRRHCNGLAIREAPFIMRPAVCADYTYRNAPPRGTPLTLYGKASPFGIDVRDFRVGAFAASNLRSRE